MGRSDLEPFSVGLPHESMLKLASRIGRSVMAEIQLIRTTVPAAARKVRSAGIGTRHAT